MQEIKKQVSSVDDSIKSMESTLTDQDPLSHKKIYGVPILGNGETGFLMTARKEDLNRLV